MSSSLVRVSRRSAPATLTLAAGRNHTADTILRAWYEGKSAHTIRSYQHDLEGFAVFLSRALAISPPLCIQEALRHLCRQSAPSAHEVALAFREHLRARETSRPAPSTGTSPPSAVSADSRGCWG